MTTAVQSPPAQWEADVLLADGSTAHLRPITPEDAGRLVAFYARVSPESKYLRFFAPYPELSAHDIHRFTHVDHHDRVALILTIGDAMVAVGRYDRLPNGHDAEVAFLVEDSQQGKGVGQLLLEHLAEAGRECGVDRFVAEILPQNRRMVQVFVDAGYTVRREFEDGMIAVEFPITPTPRSVEVMRRREHRAEALSVRRLLTPRSLLVVGEAERTAPIVQTLTAGGFTGQIDCGTVNELAGREELTADVVITVGPVDDQLAAIAVAVRAGAFGIYALHAGSYGGVRNRDVVAAARAAGLRMLGPDALSVISPANAMNAGWGPMPRPGTVGMFCQSSGVGVILLSAALEQQLGLSMFVSSGIHADVTANDVMQYWLDDDSTGVCVLSLDRIGNPRKFTRIARELAGRKPVILFSPGRSQRDIRQGADEGLPSAPGAAIDALFEQAGIIVCPRRDEMYDVAQILARQPLPAGDGVRVITNSPALSTHIVRVGTSAGLDGEHPHLLPSNADADAYVSEVTAALAEDIVDAVVVCVVDVFSSVAQAAYAGLSEIAATATKPVVAVFAGFTGRVFPAAGADGPGTLPVFTSYADALTALGAARAYARWRDTDHGPVAQPERDLAAAEALIDQVLTQTPAGRELTEAEANTLLGHYGIAVAEGETEGVDLVVSSMEDRSFGPILSVGLAGPASELLGDVAHRVPPLTTGDAAGMLRELKAYPLIEGHDLAAVEDLLARLARLAEDHPQLAQVRLCPVTVGAVGLVVRHAQITVHPGPDVRDAQSRSLA